MAGFDFSFHRRPNAEALQRTLLRHIQRASVERGLKFSYRIEGDRFWGELDGPLPYMQTLFMALDAELRIAAGAFPQPSRRRDREIVAADLLNEFAHGLDRITDSIQEIADRAGAIPNSFVFDVGEKTHLRPTMHALTRTLVLHLDGWVAPRTVVEETHTALEHVLRAYLGGAGRDRSFSRMLGDVARAGVLSPSEVESLDRLKELRREAKHRGQGFRADEADQLVAVAVVALHKLLSARG